MDTTRPRKPIAPTYTESWKLWCLALHLLRQPRAEAGSLLAKRSEEDAAELRRRMTVIGKTRAIPVAEFLS